MEKGEKGKKRSKKGKLVSSFLYVETMGVNSVDMPDPHLFSAETDRFLAVSKYVACFFLSHFAFEKESATRFET